MEYVYLTATEKTVFKVMVTGASNPEISRNLVISKHTAKAHVSHIITKLNAKNRTDAVVKGLLMILGITDDINASIENFDEKRNS